MTPRGTSIGAKPFPAAETTHRLAFARKAHETADLVATDDDPSAKQVAIGLYVLAGIASADVICGRLVNRRWRGEDHGGAGRFLLESASNDARLDAAQLQRHLTTLTTMKDLAHYSAEVVTTTIVKKAGRASAALLDAGVTVSRG